MILDSIFNLVIAFLLGFFIGLERQFRQRNAGLRTHILVTMGAAAFVSVASNLTGTDGAVRVVSYVVSGIGFIGAGVIMRQDGGVQGLNTSATIWCCGAVGAASGAGLYTISIATALLILSINVLLRPIVNFIDRKPLNEKSEITHNINIITDVENGKKVIEKIRATLTTKNIQMTDFNINSFGANQIMIKAVLNVTSISPEEMNEILDTLNENDLVEYAFCSLM
ncbi:MgtC/SapB family protein [Klebsiella pneumoniae]|uniref:MgtC/SapB family protein n=1 Tax=Klebsiella pneumoniae TaxID=573 RepID=UPI003F662D83